MTRSSTCKRLGHEKFDSMDDVPNKVQFPEGDNPEGDNPEGIIFHVKLRKWNLSNKTWKVPASAKILPKDSDEKNSISQRFLHKHNLCKLLVLPSANRDPQSTDVKDPVTLNWNLEGRDGEGKDSEFLVRNDDSIHIILRRSSMEEIKERKERKDIKEKKEKWRAFGAKADPVLREQKADIAEKVIPKGVARDGDILQRFGVGPRRPVHNPREHNVEITNSSSPESVSTPATSKTGSTGAKSSTGTPDTQYSTVTDRGSDPPRSRDGKKKSGDTGLGICNHGRGDRR